MGKMSRLLSIFRSKSGSNPVSSSYRDDDVQDGIALDGGPMTPRESLILTRCSLARTADGEISPNSSFTRRKSMEEHCPQARDMVLLDPMITDVELNDAMKKRIVELEQENREILLSLPQPPLFCSRDRKDMEIKVINDGNERKEEKGKMVDILGKEDSQGVDKKERAASFDLAKAHGRDEESEVCSQSRDPELDRMKLEKNLSIIRSLQLNLLDE